MVSVPRIPPQYWQGQPPGPPPPIPLANTSPRQFTGGPGGARGVRARPLNRMAPRLERPERVGTVRVGRGRRGIGEDHLVAKAADASRTRLDLGQVDAAR